jgi:UDP-N-acetylglucosamine transferase subunit ALG13
VEAFTMILVTVGTTDFDDLVVRMDELAATMTEEVVAQIGRGDHVPQHMTSFRFAPSLEPYYERARLVIAHGGLGTAIEVIQRGLPLIALSNPDRYDRHQDDLLRALEQRGHLIWCRDLAMLPEALQQVEQRRFTPYETPECAIAQVIRQLLGLT